MAVTKIKAIKTTLNKALDYIQNPEKTDGQMLVSGYNTDPLSASVEFSMTQRLARETNGDYRKTGGANNLAYHLMQSFSPKDNITQDQAHEIGKKLAADFLEGRFEYVVTTHLDKGHIHNHIIINAVSFYDHKKLQTKPYKTAAQIRAISDRLCKDNALSVLPEMGNIGVSRTEYLARKANNSWKSEIRKRLKYILETAASYEQFLEFASALNVTVNADGKYIKYQLIGQERYTRGNKLSTGDDFLPDGIKRRVSENAKHFTAVKKAITALAPKSVSLDAFIQSLEDEYSICMKTYKSGKTVFSTDGVNVPDYALGSSFSRENIENVIRTGDTELLNTITSEDQYSELFIKNTARRIKAEDTCIRIDNRVISKVTVEGILLEMPDSAGRIGTVFIDKRSVIYDADTHGYSIYIGDAYDYYFIEDDIDPDVLESNQLSQRFVKGEDIIRGLNEAMGIEPKEVEVFMSDIRAITLDGVIVSLPELGIGSLFIKMDHVTIDRLNNSCTVKIFDDWHYDFYGADKEKGRMNGSRLSELLEQRIGSNLGLYRRVAWMQNREASAKLQNLSETLMVIRRENITYTEDFTLRIRSLLEKAAEVKGVISTLEKKNQQYNQAAKYLLAIQDYQEKKRSSGLSDSAFKQRFEGESLAYSHAVSQLNKLGVNLKVDPQKVLARVDEQSRRAEDLTAYFKTIEKQIESIRDAQAVVNEALRDETNQMDQRDIAIEQIQL